MSTRRFTCIKGSSTSKFWEIDDPYKAEGQWVVDVHFGKIGTVGQDHSNVFHYENEALKHYHRKVAEKLGKGYKETGQVSVKKNVVNYTPSYIPAPPPKPACLHNVITRSGSKWKCQACGKIVDFGGNSAPAADDPLEVVVKVRRFFNLGKAAE